LAYQLLKLSAPSAAEVGLFGILPLIHAYWVGRLGGEALAAVAMGTSLYVVLSSPMRGISRGGMAVVARYTGGKDHRHANQAAGQTLLLLLVCSLPIAILGLTLGKTLLYWMGARGDVAQGALIYLRMMMWGLIAMELIPCLDNVIRGAGHPEVTVRFNVITVAVTAIVEPVLVLGLGPFAPLGIYGAGWAIILGSSAGVLDQLGVLRSGSAGLQLRPTDLRPDRDTIRHILRIGLPSSLQRLSPNLASALLMAIVASLGTPVLVAYSIVTRIFGLLQCPIMGIGLGAATIVGQSLGAAHPQRAADATSLGIKAGIATALLLFGLLNMWPELGLRRFTQDDAVIAVGIQGIRFTLLWGLAAAIAMVLLCTLEGAGDTVATTAVQIVSLWLVQLPLCWLLPRTFGLGSAGIWLALFMTQCANAAALFWRFRVGSWQRIRI
jgi:putative MATE family efflux protein